MEKIIKISKTINMEPALYDRIIQATAISTRIEKKKITQQSFCLGAIEKECERVEALEKGGSK